MLKEISVKEIHLDPADLKRTLREFCILSPRKLSPTNSLKENENTNQPEAEAEPVPEAEGEGRVPAHLYFEDNNPVYGPLTQVDSQMS